MQSRSFFLCVAMAAALALTSQAQETTPGPRPKARGKEKNAGPEPTEKRVYKKIGETSLELWIWRPEGWQASDKRGAIVFYHGGGWRGGNPIAFSRQSAALAKLGMVAISVQYRLTSQPGVTVSDCVKDARSAFRWVSGHASELGIDPSKIAAGRGSAGGHLAASLVSLSEINDEMDDKTVAINPAALVLFNPAVKLDFRRAAELTATKQEETLGVSPFHHLKAGHPPTIIFHGDADTTVPIDTVQAYAAKVTELGGSCEVVSFSGQQHAFFNKEPFVWDTLKRAELFLAKQGLLDK